MARGLVIEEESGTCSGFVHPHNGYYAGDFHRTDVASLPALRLAPFTEEASVGATVLWMAAGVAHVDDRTHPRAA
jgi:hypothetical protein